MAEPISDEKFAILQAVHNHCGTVVVNAEEWKGILARIHIEQDRAGEAEGLMHGCLSDGDVARLKDEEFNAGVERAAVWHDERVAAAEALLWTGDNMAVERNIAHHRNAATALRALKRPIPKVSPSGDTPAGEGVGRA